MKQRTFIKNRSNRRKENKPFDGEDKRTGLGRRRKEKLQHLINRSILPGIAFIVLSLAIAVFFVYK
tara:strand:+ start:2588 stop:2785 length:198 start_codon:yes stop_codon:yes gene_type:complete